MQLGQIKKAKQAADKLSHTYVGLAVSKFTHSEVLELALLPWVVTVAERLNGQSTQEMVLLEGPSNVSVRCHKPS